MVAFTSVSRAQNPPAQQLRGHIPEAAKRLTPIGHENSADHLQLAIGLPLRNQDELTNLLQQIYDPASTNYHHYLTPEEFTARFGPTEADYQAVVQYAQRNGFTVTATHPNRLVLDVDASVGDIERALHLEMRTFQHPTEARTFHAPSAEPTVDLAVPILHISGLDNYSLPHPNSRLKPPELVANATPKAGSGPGGAYRGGDFRAAYSVGPLTGVGQSVALLQFDGYYANDIATYESQAGIPSVTLTNVAIDGGVSTPGSGVSEVSLDIEMVVSMAPGVSRIIVYEAPNPSPWVDLLSRMANDNIAKQIGCSWGGGSPDPTSEQIFLQFAAEGISFFNATGDSDAFTGAIPFPSDSTNITQVGGTTLTTTGAGGSYVSETAWNWGLTQGSYVGSSGGVSTTYKIPPWQQGINMSANLGSTTMRNTPDVALTGDNVYVIYGNGTTGTFGGTSCAAPLWAAFTALINQQASAGSNPPVGFLNPALYAIGKSNPNYATIFHDITSGNNFSASSPGKFPAVAGYDLCTGWGTPNGTNLINALITPVYFPVLASAGTSLVAEGCLPANGVIDSGETVTVNFSLKNVGTADTTNLVVTMLATNGAALPSGPQSYGALAAGAPAVTRSFTFTAIGSCGGTANVTLQLQDGVANLGVINFSFPLGKLGPNFLENFDSSSALPTGWATTGTPWVVASSVADSAPNSAFAAGQTTAQLNTLVTPLIALPPGPQSQLSFRNNYDLEFSGSTAYDAGVLEIKIGAGSFQDILSAGGSFVTGGYNKTVSKQFSNPLRSRQAWGGNSGGFINTIVNLPASASGQTVQFRWSIGSDNSVASTGWYIDSVAISNIVCCSGNAADLALNESTSSALMNLSSNVTFSLTVTNLGPNQASSVVVTDSLPAGFTFTTATVSQGSWSNVGNLFSASLGAIANQGSATITIQAAATAAGSWTNSASVSSATPEIDSSNNSAFTTAAINSLPSISAMTNITTAQDTPAGPIGFVIGDAETPASGLVLSAASSNTNLIDAAHIIFGGSGANPTVTLTPLTNQYGVATITLDVSDGMADSTAAFTFTVLPVNHPAVLAVIPDYVIFEKDVLQFTTKADDQDVPAQTLTYTLSNAPAGASVDSATGVFNWTPTEAQGPSTNVITMIVTDNGSPPLSTVRNFTVAVLESNEPPVLAPIADYSIHAGMTLTLTNSATDPDIPTNTLTFEVYPGPAGASVDPTNGIFTWTPDNSFAGTTNSVTIVVTDDNPLAVNEQQLSDAKTFQVYVAPPLTVSGAILSNDTLTITWNSISGTTYRVQYDSQLGDTNWIDLPPDVLATDVTSSQTDTNLTDPQRFYRVLVVP